MTTVVQLSDYLPSRQEPSRQKKPCLKSQYERYPLPFFRATGRVRLTWNVVPSGDFWADHATGEGYAIEFLKDYATVAANGRHCWLRSSAI